MADIMMKIMLIDLNHSDMDHHSSALIALILLVRIHTDLGFDPKANQ